ncbi:helix-turn-helix domain-containing protein [Dactylosporangium sp. NPDC051541]|uniref:helix-turn-helix domain-containing protein n=1 Tax=Dactylosporangium sp. NPDC051541 TaxID=3363977 RepID=UPI003791E25D
MEILQTGLHLFRLGQRECLVRDRSSAILEKEVHVVGSATKGGTTFPARRLGAFLRQLREESANTVAGAAAAMEWGRNKLYKVEAGHTVLKGHELVSLCAVYGVTHVTNRDTLEALLALLSEAKEKGYYHAYGDVIPEWFELYVDLERAASRLRMYCPLLVPGLLQTREYAAEIVGQKPGRPAAVTEQIVNLRLERQKLLRRRVPKAPKLSVIVEESALRRPLPNGASNVQIQRLLTASESSNIIIRVIPASTGPHRTLVAGEFVILDFAMDGGRPADPATIYLESLTGALYLDKPTVVDEYVSAWIALEARAWDEESSRHLMSQMIEETVDA